MAEEIKSLNALLLPVDETNWSEQLNKPISERAGYAFEDGHLSFGQVVGRILGINSLFEEEYFNALFDLSQNPKVSILSECLDKRIDTDALKEVQSIIELHKKGELTLNRMMAFLTGKKLIPPLKSYALNQQVHKTLLHVFKEFENNHPQGFKDPNFYRVLTDIIKFYRNHYAKWMDDFTLGNDMPKVIWYGNATKSQQYFLLFLMLSGCDVLFFHPEGADNFSDIDSAKEKMFVKTFEETTALVPFPKERITRQATVTRRAEVELERVLNHDGSMFYKPWQFREYTPSSLTLRTTYDELYLLIKEKAYIRHNFDVKNREVHIPSIFAKISGMSRNKNDYWNKLHSLWSHEYTLSFKDGGFKNEVKAAAVYYHYQHSLTSGVLDIDKMMSSQWWKYKQLSSGIQKGIAGAISRYCEEMKMKKLNGESDQDLKLYMFAQATNIPQEFLQLLQRFDYSQEVPKIVVYLNEHSRGITRSDAALLLLMHEIGLDIVVYNPSGHMDIEQYILEDVFDTHLLDDMVFNQSFQEPTIRTSLSGIINKLRERF